MKKFCGFGFLRMDNQPYENLIRSCGCIGGKGGIRCGFSDVILNLTLLYNFLFF